MKKVIQGFKIYFSGMRLWASHGSLLRLSIIPFILDLVCLVFGLYFTITRIPILVSKLVHTPEFCPSRCEPKVACGRGLRKVPKIGAP